MWAGMGLLVCNVGTTAAGDDGETVFIPATQVAHEAPNLQYLPGLGTDATDSASTAGIAGNPMNNRAGVMACAL